MRIIIVAIACLIKYRLEKITAGVTVSETLNRFEFPNASNFYFLLSLKKRNNFGRHKIYLPTHLPSFLENKALVVIVIHITIKWCCFIAMPPAQFFFISFGK